jgi:flagellar basal-body rod protein FlgC
MRVTGIVESDAPLVRRYEPNHLKADEEGYVYYPNVNVVEEMADMISASRSFQVNVELMNSAKQMMQGLLRLGQ